MSYQYLVFGLDQPHSKIELSFSLKMVDEIV